MHIDTGINQELKPRHPRRPSLPGLVTKGRREELHLCVYVINVHSMFSRCPAVVMSRTPDVLGTESFAQVLWTGY